MPIRRSGPIATLLFSIRRTENEAPEKVAPVGIFGEPFLALTTANGCGEVH
jgi:hypothetical protein